MPYLVVHMLQLTRYFKSWHWVSRGHFATVIHQSLLSSLCPLSPPSRILNAANRKFVREETEDTEREVLPLIYEIKWVALFFSDGELGQVEVVGQADQSDAVQAHCCADAQGGTAGQSTQLISMISRLPTVEIPLTCFTTAWLGRCTMYPYWLPQNSKVIEWCHYNNVNLVDTHLCWRFGAVVASFVVDSTIRYIEPS